MKKIKFWQAVATLVGTVIGAGILGIPYVFAQVGILPGIILLIFLGLATLVVNLMFAEIILRTRYRQQLAGYAKKYLGNGAYFAGSVAVLLGSYGALTAYLIGQGEVLSAIFGGSSFLYSLIFFGFVALILLGGLRYVKVFELWMVSFFVVIVMVIVGLSLGHIQLENLQYVNLSKILVPYGVLLFAYGGAGAIVPVREILRREESKLRPAVILGTLLPMALYGIFALVVVGVTGVQTSEVASVGLGQKIGPYMVVLGNLFAFFAMGSSFLSMGIILKEVFHLDFGFSKISSWFFVVTVPVGLFLLGLRDFIETIGIAGSLTFGLTGIIIVLTFWKSKKRGDRKPEFSLPKFKIVGALLILMFLAGFVHTLLKIFS